MKILFLSYTYHPPHFGGELLISAERFESLGENGMEIVIVTSGKSARDINQNEAKNIKIIRTRSFGESKPARLISRLYFLIYGLVFLIVSRYDWLHYGTAALPKELNFIWQILANLVTRMKGSRSVHVLSLMESANSSLNVTGSRHLFKRLFFNTVSKIVCIAPKIYKDIGSLYANKAALILNGINTNHFYVHAGRSDRDESATLNFLTIGTVCYRKGTDLLIRGFLLIKKQYPEAKLTIVGPCSTADNANVSAEEYVEIMSMAGNCSDIKFVGRVDNRDRIREFIHASDIVVFPSRREGFGLVPGEAMACGRPVIQSLLKGVTDVINIHGLSGLFYEDLEDYHELSRLMAELAADRKSREEMGLAASEIVTKSFSWDKHIKEWKDFYEN